MLDLKSQLQQRLVANVIIDICANNHIIIFSDSWCTQDRVVRFTTPFLQGVFKTKTDNSGLWKNGNTAMYEVNITPDAISVSCNFSKENKQIFDILSQFKTFSMVDNEVYSLKKWECNSNNSIDKVFDFFVDFLENELKKFEDDLSKFIEEKNNEKFTEGDKQQVLSSKYERNLKAREACLKYHGTACAVCGIDFAVVYGPEFAGKIEVHHIVPISEIGKEYVVDPIKDLVPLCPNCHTAIHSKKDGVYTIDEMKKLLNK